MGMVRTYLASLEDLMLKVTGASSAGASSAMVVDSTSCRPTVQSRYTVDVVGG